MHITEDVTFIASDFGAQSGNKLVFESICRCLGS